MAQRRTISDRLACIETKLGTHEWMLKLLVGTNMVSVAGLVITLVIFIAR